MAPELLFVAGICFNVFLVALSVNLAYLRYWPQQLHLDPYACIPRPSFVHGRLTLPYTDQHPVAHVASYDEALQAFLQFQFLLATNPTMWRYRRAATANRYAMADWLQQCRIRTIAMQSTGVYWVAVYDILEQAGFEVYLVNARDTKNLPGHKATCKRVSGS